MKRTSWTLKVERKHPDQRRLHRRPMVEELESRCLFSVTAVDGVRPIDEVGNNALNSTWGAAPADQPGGGPIQLLRLSPVAYTDGISTPSLPYKVNGIVVNPSPRTISNDVFNQSPSLYGSPSTDVNTVDGNGLSDFGYSFGQFMDHDMDLTLDQTGLPVPPGDSAANKDGDDGFPIPADTTQPAAVGPDPIGSLAFSRSQYDPTTGTSTSNPRQQTTVVTSYLDLSQVYGSSQVVADALRTFSGGQLKTSPGDMLPFNNLTYFTQDQLNALAMQNNGPLPNSQLYAAGDARANENTELTSLTTLFVRNHNLIASELQAIHPHWTDEQLYQEARALNIAEYQNIIYTEYLPDLLGPNAMPAYAGYDPTVNATIDTEFSTVAFRFGHSMLNNTVARDANNGTSVGGVPLGEDFFDPNLVNPNGIIDPTTGLISTDIGAYLKGDADNSSQAVDAMAVSSVRDDLFGNGVPGGEDLISRDIWRGRDDGIGTYNQVRVAFGLPAITDTSITETDPVTGNTFISHGFEQITSNVHVQYELETAYASTIATGGFAGDIDSFVGGMAEDHVPGSDLGPLFTTILTNQFSRLESGDRFFYLNETFDGSERSILQSGSALGEIIMANTNVTNLQADVFVNPVLSTENAMTKHDYTTENGRATLTGSTTSDTVLPALYSSLVSDLSNPNLPGYLVLVGPDGNYEPDSLLQSYTSIKGYLRGASAGDSAYALSAQLLTADINVNLGYVSATNSVYVPAVTLSSGNDLSTALQNSLINNGVSAPTGVANIQIVLNAASAALLAAPNPSGDTASDDSGNADTAEVRFQKALKDVLWGINNNEDIFIL